MSSTPYLRYPNLHEDQVTFVAEDDVWVAPLAGGRAWRISSLQLPARNPRFSPDGSMIAWTVVQGGAPEVVAADTEGGNFRQLTFWGNQHTRVRGFSPAGNIIATSPFEFEDMRLRWAYEVPLDGTAPTRLPYGPVDTLAAGPALGDERPLVLGTVLSREPARWKRYRGGTAGKLWIDADGNGEFTRLMPQLDGNLAYPMWVQGRIAFFSDHEGYGNIYSVTPAGTDLRRHTDFQDFYVRHPSSDGTRVVFESAGSLWLLEDLDADPVRLDITLGSAGTGRRPRPLNVPRHLRAAAPDTAGKSSVVESHGTLHWLTHKDGPSRVIEATAGVRARLGRPLTGGRAVFVADPGNEEALFIKDVFGSLPTGTEKRDVPSAALAASTAPAAVQEAPELPKPVSASGTVHPVHAAGGSEDETQPQVPSAASGAGASEAVLASQDTAAESGLTRIAFPAPTRTSELLPSPDGRLVAAATEFGQVYLLDVEAAELSLVADSGHGPVDDLAFSPDSRWLAWAEPVSGEGARTRIRLRKADGTEEEQIQDVTDGRFHDHSPSFTRDGRFLAFLSERSFDPVYDTHGFDLGFPTSTKPFMVALAAATPSPFGPAAHVVEPAEPAATVESDDPQDDPGRAAETAVDLDRLAERIIAVPVPQGRYSKLRAADGALLWLAEDVYGVTGDGRASSADRNPGKRLERFDLGKKDASVLVPALDDYELSGDGSTVVLRHEQRVRAVPAASRTEEDSAENITVDLTRIRVLLEPVKVWGQAFDEAWRLQRDFFWTPDMGGLDWEAVHARYRPLVDHLGSHDDLVDLLWELHGELGTSHAYVTSAPVAEAGGSQGFLGADLRPGPGGWEVARILDPESSDPQAISPLSAPGADVRPGDVIAAVDGLPVPEDKGPAALLVGAGGRVVELTVLRREETAGPQERRIAVVPLRSEERLRYQNWVNGNRRAVRAASDGRFGYLHIPDMVASGWAQLHRDLDSEAAKGALIIDVRHNRGGHTSQLVAELIGRKVTAWSLPRGQEAGTYPAQSPRGPVVILADEFAGSDGDIVTQVAKLRGIGPVIGTRTWGGVVGIDGRFQLADGTSVTQPRYAFWFTGGVGFGVENRGVEPDIEVPYPPHSYAAGEDPQLEAGVAILKEMLSEIPTDQPPARDGYPVLRPAPLPPRPQDVPRAEAGTEAGGKAGSGRIAGVGSRDGD